MKSTLKKLWFLIVLILLISVISIIAALIQNEAGSRSVKTSAEHSCLTVIIDAGHGGEDGGAVSRTGAKESEINLEIARKLDLIMGFYGVRTTMTRMSETLEYSRKSHTIREKKAEDQNRRLQLINGTQNAVLLSIHQNKFPDGSPFGAQILYAPTNSSKEFGEAMQKLLITALNPKSRRAASKVPDSILLLNHIKCPALIIECGFLSNDIEEKLLLSETYQLKIAAAVAVGYITNQSRLSSVYSGGTNEGNEG